MPHVPAAERIGRSEQANMTIPKCIGTHVSRVTPRHATRGTACETEDIHAGARTRLMDFIVQRAFYPVPMADRPEFTGR